MSSAVLARFTAGAAASAGIAANGKFTSGGDETRSVAPRREAALAERRCFDFVLNCYKKRLQSLERRGIWVQTTNTQLKDNNYTPLGSH